MVDVLRSQIQENMKAAMRGKEELTLITLRMLLAEIKKADIEKRVDAASDRASALLSDNEILVVISRMIKQRLDSAEQYKKANRSELAAKEEAEINILRAYLPTQLSENEVQELINAAIFEVSATKPSDMAKVMAFIKEKAQGRVDMGKVSTLIKSRLAGGA